MRTYLLTIKKQTVLVAIVFILQGVHSLRWLGINSTLVNKSNDSDVRRYLCSSAVTASKNRLLDKEQKRVCRQRIKMMKYVIAAAELAKTECLKLSAFERWDCKGILQLQEPRFPKDLRGGTKQVAFLYALSSAALVYEVTRACATEQVCRCGRQPSRSLIRRYQPKLPGKKYQYDGCHDNIAVGIKMSKEFLDSSEIRRRKSNDKKIVNLHNIDLGRQIVRDSLTLHCRCHGMTGTCPLETCTRYLLVNFSVIARKIFNLYKKASQVELLNSGNGRRKELVIKKRKQRILKANDMGYLLKSRDFCVPDEKNNLPGTKGRLCGQKFVGGNFRATSSVNTTAFNVCEHLCCKRKYTTITTSKVEKCRCKFDWDIMDVNCKICRVTKQIYVCE